MEVRRLEEEGRMVDVIAVEMMEAVTVEVVEMADDRITMARRRRSILRLHDSVLLKPQKQQHRQTRM